MVWIVGAVCFLLALAGAAGGLLYRHSRGPAAATEPGPAADLPRSWMGRVTGRAESTEHLTRGPHAGRAVRKLTVFWVEDGGREGSVFAYEHDAMRETYVGELAHYREAPRYAELCAWSEGDRIYKAAGRYFPTLASR